ncbi:MAG: patatin-like phospholipase family protein [Lachnospiraceae bacterium]|nr:patatin-like phospholipase family protein [Lachnospiraceae bacterium]
MDNDWTKWLAVDDETADLVKSIDSGFEKAKRYKQEINHPFEKNERYNKMAEELMGLEDKAKNAASGIGLVLCGGGAKGSYQVGALKAFSEANIEFSAYSGASVGGLNAALMGAGGVALAEQMWDGLNESLLSVKDIVSPDLTNDIELEMHIKNSGILEKLTLDSPLTSVTVFDKETAYPEDAILNTKSAENKLKWLMATAAFPIAFEQQVIDGEIYLDGGIPIFGNNMPVAPLYYMGLRRMVIIHLASKKESNVNLEFFNNYENRELYFNGLKAIHIYPSEDLGELFDGTMNFNREYLDRIETLGYEDAKKAISYISELDNEIAEDTEMHLVDGKKYESYYTVLRGLK